MSKGVVIAVRAAAGIAAVSLFLFLPPPSGWHVFAGILYGLMMPFAEDVSQFTYPLLSAGMEPQMGRGRRRYVLLALGLAAWIGTLITLPVYGLLDADTRPTALFLMGTLPGSVAYTMLAMSARPE